MNTKLPESYDAWVKQGDESGASLEIDTLTKEDIDALPEPLRELMHQLANTLDNPHSCG